MGDDLKIDSHKLNFHPRWVADWLEAGDDWEKAKKIYPIYLEISPVGHCNHRCIFCALDFMGYKKVSLETNVLKERISEMAALGVKSIMFAGEGEPLLHKNMAEIAVHTKNAEIDVSFTTNGSLLTEKFCREAIGFVEWIKVSVDAGMASTYAKVHGVSARQFPKIVENIARAVKIRNEIKSGCTIGSQMLLLPENQREFVVLAEKMKSIGCDYLVIKPHSQHPQSNVKRYANLDYADIVLANLDWLALTRLSNPSFQIIFREDAFERLEEGKSYEECPSVPFLWGYITAAGDVYSCSVFLGDERFLLGNIYKHSFREIWEGESRRKNWIMMKEFCAANCRKNCRMESENAYLDTIKNRRPRHINFV